MGAVKWLVGGMNLLLTLKLYLLRKPHARFVTCLTSVKYNSELFKRSRWRPFKFEDPLKSILNFTASG